MTCLRCGMVSIYPFEIVFYFNHKIHFILQIFPNLKFFIRSFSLGFADLEMLSDIIKENYSYWELECQKEENGNAEEVTSSTNTTMDKKSTEEKKEATPSNENNTLTTTEGSSTSTSRKENEENGRPSEENKSA